MKAYKRGFFSVKGVFLRREKKNTHQNQIAPKQLKKTLSKIDI